MRPVGRRITSENIRRKTVRDKFRWKQPGNTKIDKKDEEALPFGRSTVAPTFDFENTAADDIGDESVINVWVSDN